MVKFSTFDEDRGLGPLALARKFFEIYDSDEVTEVSSHLGRLKADAATHSFTTIEFSFRAEAIGNEFKMEPFQPPANIDSKLRVSPLNSQRFSEANELGGDVGQLARIIKQAVNKSSRTVGDAEWEFVELEAQSHGHMYLTDYSFTYELTEEVPVIERAENVIDKVV